jgi:hypothetical protein
MSPLKLPGSGHWPWFSFDGNRAVLAVVHALLPVITGAPQRLIIHISAVFVSESTDDERKVYVRRTNSAWDALYVAPLLIRNGHLKRVLPILPAVAQSTT